MKHVFCLALASLSLVTMADTPAEKAARMRWFRDARFGLFIHWGVYAVPAGKYGDKTGFGEWIMESAQVPVAQYEQWRDQFNPTKFDARDWARMAKDAGVKYVVITTKHHDGFALFDSKVSDWDVMSTPFQRDIMKELSEAVRQEGLVQGWYHSIMDWHHPHYTPHRAWSTAPPANASFDVYEDYLHAQVKELLTKYGPIGVMWFDGEWERTWNHERGQRLYDLCRSLQPSVIVNNRVDVGRGGMAGMSDAGYAGDYGTPEQEVPSQGIPGVDWESCMTMNSHWGYNAWDKNFKSTTELVRLLVDVASKGGNLLLNVGPKADGTWPEESVQRLNEMGQWMKVNGESIYGTSASLFRDTPWGRSTSKGNTLYLHVFDPPADGNLVVHGIGNRVLSAKVLGSSAAAKFEQTKDGLKVQLRAAREHATVVKVQLSGKPIIFDRPRIVVPANEFVNAVTVKFESNSGVQVRYRLNNSKTERVAPRTLVVSKTTLITARSYFKGEPVSEEVTIKLTKQLPWKALDIPKGSVKGIMRYTTFGAFDKVPETRPESFRVVTKVGLGGHTATENISLSFQGYVYISQSDAYQFALLSDDGSKLWIDERLIVDNDGLHSPTEKFGHAPLAKGWHKIRVDWFNRTGGAALGLRMARISGTLRPIETDSLRAINP